ncbi:MAG: hypothetical protein IBX64_13470, partial [Actinobacteria bacterium]|nr:hypothetical protein [Actinomycetota bacterium]
MMRFDWSSSSSILEGFGGEKITLHVLKTGLPFFDVLRLYGAIDLYIGLREDVAIHDQGDRWEITGNYRKHRVAGRDVSTFRYIWTKRKPEPDNYCKALRDSLADGIPFNEETYAPAVKAFKGLDSSLQAGIRDVSAARYETLESGQTSGSTCCVTRIPLSDGLLAYCGKQRTERIGDIVFLPIFEGQIDLSKVVSPLRAWIGMPNVLCAQALALLALKTSLFAEGYHDRLTAVVYKTNFKGQRSDNYAGLIDIASTAIGRIKSSGFVAHAYLVFRRLVDKAWLKQGRQFKSTKLTPDALAMAYWMMQPVGK